MYDFYGNPPKTKEQIREYLVTWLVKNENPPIEEFDNHQYVQEYGFSRAGYSHCVFKDLKTNEYIWYVLQREQCIVKLPESRHSVFNTMLESVVENYYKQWKLNKSEKIQDLIQIAENGITDVE
jgi:hypothetical protein